MRNAAQALVVILILLVLMAMIAPAIVKVREAADRSQCTNNLRLLALAISNYLDTEEGAFPQAAMPNPNLPPEKRLSWVVGIWPWVEAGPLYSKMDHEKAWDAEVNRFAALTVLFTLQCPAHPERPPVSSFAPTYYIGISGIGENAIALPQEDPRAGIFAYNREVKRTDLLKRGTSETLLMVETSQANGAWTAAGPPTTRGLEPNGAPYLGVGGQFGGNHPHGANVVFADGSVRFIEQTIDPSVWEAMATLSGKGN